jgi:hypothetical protein
MREGAWLMPKATIRIGELLAEIFSSSAKSTNTASMSIYSSSPVTCPLCHTKVKPRTLHKCRKESK